MRRYPRSRMGSDADVYHGERVGDPYRWLEATGDPETVGWITAQNVATESFLAGVAARGPIRAAVTRMWDYPRLGVPFERGGRWFQFRNPGLDAQPALWLLAGPGVPAGPLLDPNALWPDGRTAVISADVSDDGSLLAYATSEAGSDWLTWRIRDVRSGTDLADVLRWSKFCRAAWRADGSGFYYAAIAPPAAGGEYLESNAAGRILLHRAGTPQAADEVVFSPPPGPDWFPWAQVSDDGRFLIVTLRKGSVFENQLHVLDLHGPQAGWMPLAGDFESSNQVAASQDATFYLVTDYRAGRNRLVAVDLDRPGREHWREIIAEAPGTLQDARFFGGHFVCHYLKDAHSVLRVHARDGSYVRDVPLPGIACLGRDQQQEWELAGHARADLMHFATTTFTDPGTIWSHQLSTGRTQLIERATAAIDPDSYLTEQVLAESADGTPVPMFVTRHKDLNHDGQAAALLFGYGGFNIPVTPSFSPDTAVWLQRGGILAVANLRGGGEYGRAWHDDGRRSRKQNVFDDFCACATWLAASGWTSRGRTAIMGGSNGGLLAGACLTQHPELFGAVVGHVGVYDMLRFHKFTMGWAWTHELGSPDDPEQYQWLRGYSPLHNVRTGTRYPATLLLTGDHDDRVVPAHSFKFAAALQAAQAADNPILIRVDTAAGHGTGKPTAKRIAADTDMLTFLAAVLPATSLGQQAQPTSHRKPGSAAPA